MTRNVSLWRWTQMRRRSVFVSLGCCNRLPWTAWFNNKHLFFIILEARTQAQADSRSHLSWMDFSWFADARGIERKECYFFPLFFFLKYEYLPGCKSSTLITISNLNHLSKTQPPVTIILSASFSAYEVLGGTQTLSPWQGSCRKLG
jgi:hypothetical protein